MRDGYEIRGNSIITTERMAGAEAGTFVLDLQHLDAHGMCTPRFEAREPDSKTLCEMACVSPMTLPGVHMIEVAPGRMGREWLWRARVDVDSYKNPGKPVQIYFETDFSPNPQHES